MNAKEIGKKIKLRRTEIGLTQSQAAHSAGLSTGTVIAIETGRSSVRIDSVMRLVGAVGLNPVALHEEPGAVNVEKEIKSLLDRLHAVADVTEVSVRVQKTTDGVASDASYGFKKS